MTGLVIKLKPKEKLLVNGVVLQNGTRGAQLRVRTSNASILRMRDAIHPETAQTPLKQLYYIAQLAMMGEAEHDEAARQIISGIDALSDVFKEPAVLEHLSKVKSAAADKKFFAVMRALKRLFTREAQLLNRIECR